MGHINTSPVTDLPVAIELPCQMFLLGAQLNAIQDSSNVKQ